MVFDAGILPDRMQVNLIDLIGNIYNGELMSGIAEMDSERYEFEEDGPVEWGFPEFFQAGAELLPHLLGQEFPELFGNSHTGIEGAITIENVGTAELSSDYFMHRDYIPATIAINRDKLTALVNECEVTEFCDGRNVSGFIRWAKDDRWSVCQVVPAIMEYFEGGNLDCMWLVDAMHDLAGEFSAGVHFA